MPVSTYEAKYIAACSTTYQALWLYYLLNELNVSFNNNVELIVDINVMVERNAWIQSFIFSISSK